jgi:hypothetical protein
MHQTTQISNYATRKWWKIVKKLFPEELDFIWKKQDMKRNDIFWQVTLYHHQLQLDNSILELTNNSTSLYWYKYLGLQTITSIWSYQLT